MITISVNWLSYILGFMSCILTAVGIGIIGYFKQIDNRYKIVNKIMEEELKKDKK